MYNFIYALGINNVGLSNAKILCDKFDWDIKKIISANKDDLNNIYGFGNIIAESIYNYFREKKNLDLINQAIKILDFIDVEKKIMSKVLNEINFVITGKLKKFKSRKVLIDLIELDKGIGKNNLLKENLFLLFLSVVTTIPLIIIGKPGTGKSLSAQLIYKSMKGKYSKNKFFRKYPQIIQTYF